MDILKNSVAVSRYYFLNEPTNHALNSSNFRQRAFHPIDETSVERGAGFVQVEDYERPLTEILTLKQFTFLRVRIDTRPIPAAVLKRRYEQALQRERKKIEEQGQKYIPRHRKQEIKEQVKMRLLPKIEPVPKTVSIVLTPGELWAFTTSQSELEAIEKILFPLLDVMMVPANLYTARHLLELKSWAIHPDSLGVISEGQTLTQLFLTHLYKQGELQNDHGELSVVRNVRLVSEEDQMSLQGKDISDWPEIDLGLQRGKQICQAGLELNINEGLFTFQLKSDWGFSTLKTPGLTDKEDIEASFLEKVYLLQKMFSAVDAFGSAAIKELPREAEAA